MGTVINFPEARRSERDRLSGTSDTAATIMILPVVRIERPVEPPPDELTKTDMPGGRKRRRRARRS